MVRGAEYESPEDRLIAQYFRPLAQHPGALALQDDAASYTPPEGYDLVITKDAIVSGVHFFETDPPETIGRKALRVNLSDLAAKGAEPAGFLMALGLPELRPDWLEAFARGLGIDTETYRCPLLGGDTVRTHGPLFVSITAFGILPRGTMIHRSGAKAGDAVMVTGTIGDAAVGLRLQRGQIADEWKLDRHAAEYLVGRYLVPEPRNALAAAVRRHATAAMDVSDGLAGDLGRLCRTSGVSAEVEIAQVPLSFAATAALQADPKLLTAILTGGDDYEIVLTLPSDRIPAFRADAEEADVAVTLIGRIVEAGGTPRFLQPDGSSVAFKHVSFSHFSDGP